MSISGKVIENGTDSKKQNGYDSSKHRMCFGRIFENSNDDAKLRMLKEETDIEEAQNQKSKIEFSKDIIE